MKFFNILICTISVLAMNSALADGNWLHKSLQLSDSVSLSIDYTSNFIDHNDVGGPSGYVTLPWINVYGLSASDQVSVVLINYDIYAQDNIDHPTMAPTQVSNQTIALHYNASSSKFTAQAGVICLQSPDAYEKYFQEVAVVINGKWYKNSGQNFRFQLQH